MAAQSNEGCEKAIEALSQDLGIVYEWAKTAPPKFEVKTEEGLDPEFDRAGLRALKVKHGA